MSEGEGSSAPPPQGGLAFGVLRLLRPWQWSKNSLCLAGVFFSGKVFEPSAVAQALGTAAVFSATSSGVYALNDALDRERDREHPTKRSRPVASGVVAPGLAYGLALVLALAGLAGRVRVRPVLLEPWEAVVLRALAGVRQTSRVAY